jgi:branched-chain amino acid transport system permease protein
MFYGISAYVTGLVVIHVYNSLLLGLAASVVASAIVAYAIGFLSIRLSGVYFAVITLAFAEVFYQLSLTLEGLTGGSDGLTGIPDIHLLGIDLGDTTLFYYVAFVAMLALYWLAVQILDTPFGRAITAIRESERRMAFLGYNTNKFKRRTFVLSGSIAGIAGTLFTTYQSFVSPSTLSWVVSGDMIVAMVLGGLGTLYGPMIGGAVFIGMSEVLSSYFQNWRLVFGLLIVGVVIFQPRGLVSVGTNLRRRLWSDTGSEREGQESDEPTGGDD